MDTATTLRPGCYLICYTPLSASSEFRHYDGTLRVSQSKTKLAISGDLYGRPAEEMAPSVSGRIPIFPIGQYRYYVRTRQPAAAFGGNTVSVTFDLRRYRPGVHAFGFTWPREETFTANLNKAPPPAPGNYPIPDGLNHPIFLTGRVLNSAGDPSGDLTLAWISPYLRRAKLQITQVQFQENGESRLAEIPLGSGDGATWQSVFDEVGWQLELEPVTTTREPAGAVWRIDHLQRELNQLCASGDLDSEWCYHLLCVREIERPPNIRMFGLMFDDYASDSNDLPRQGAAIASHELMPWPAPGVRCGLAPKSYFRTAVHEICHAMGLYHNRRGLSLMRQTRYLAEASKKKPFPNNVRWKLLARDAHRLRHMPDMWNRPGGTTFEPDIITYRTTPMSAGDSAARTRDVARGLRLQLSPLLSPLPLGAPARINLTLTTGKREFVPRSIGFKSGHLTGFARWLDRSRAKPCRFRSLFRCTDFNEQLRPLDPGDGLVEAVTLLRGKGGALFPEPGRYEVVVWLDWADASGAPRSLTARTELTVADSTPPSDAARELRDNPNTLLALVIGGEDFHQAILPALADPILRPHYLIIEAKRLQRLGKTIEACQLLLDERAWLSGSEIGRLAEMLLPAKGAPKALREKVRAFLKKLAGAMPASVDDGVTSFLEQFIPP